jgi:hypothetical protein
VWLAVVNALEGSWAITVKECKLTTALQSTRAMFIVNNEMMMKTGCEGESRALLV